MAYPPIMFTDVALSDAAARLEELLPGISRYATAKTVDAQARMREIWARVHPGRAVPLPIVPPGLAALQQADLAVDFALQHGLPVERRFLGENYGQRSDAELLHVILGDLAEAPEDVFVVSLPHCRRVHRGSLREFVLRGPEITDDRSFTGDDELFICASSRRIVVLHHEGWVFDLRP